MASDVHELKRQTRRAGFDTRSGLRDPASDDAANLHLLEHVLSRRPQVVSAYMAIRTEIDPLQTMIALVDHGTRVCVPITGSAGEPLSFREWTPAAEMVEAGFGVSVPVGTPELVPDLLITPMICFDRNCNRLGYGGGFYDRTITQLRDRGAAVAVGFAYSGQEIDEVPVDDGDVRLDSIVTEAGVLIC